MGTEILRAQVGLSRITSVSMSLDGYTLAIGEVIANADGEGTVARVFDFALGDWKESNGTGLQGHESGTAYIVALSGDGMRLAISNYYYLSFDGGDANDPLDVRAFQRTNDDWAPLGEPLHAFAQGEKSGYFISLSDDGSAMCMGDPGRSGVMGAGASTGHSHVYRWNGTDWYQHGPNLYGTSTADQFGYDCAISGDGHHYAVSAPFNHDLGTSIGHGQVKVYDIVD